MIYQRDVICQHYTLIKSYLDFIDFDPTQIWVTFTQISLRSNILRKWVFNENYSKVGKNNRLKLSFWVGLSENWVKASFVFEVRFCWNLSFSVQACNGIFGIVFNLRCTLKHAGLNVTSWRKALIALRMHHHHTIMIADRPPAVQRARNNHDEWVFRDKFQLHDSHVAHFSSDNET